MILWAVPAGVSALAIVAVLVVLGKVAQEMTAVRDTVAGLAELRGEVGALRGGVGTIRDTFAQLTSR